MKVVIWIVQVVLALAFLGAGGMKLFTPYEQLLANPGMEWVGDFSVLQIRIISALEILGALGLILPMFISKYRMLVPVAAIGLALIMVGAAITHIGRGEPFVPNIVLFVLAGLTFWWRKGFLKKS